MKKDEKVLGPFKIEATIYLTNDDGQIGKAAYTLPVGRPATIAEIAVAAQKTMEQVGNGFRLLNEEEFWDQLLIDKYGVHIATACPDSVDFDPAFKVVSE